MTASHSENEPTLTDSFLPDRPTAITLVLHGGAEHGTTPVDHRSLTWRRGRALAHHLAPPLTHGGVGVVLLRFRMKGWNAGSGHLPAPVVDARWALDALRAQYDLPIVIVGHSMGGRTGVAVADHPSVRGVVALAPWLPPEDPVTPLTGKMLRAAHGRSDKITSARSTQRFVARAEAVADAEFTDMGRVGHYLMRRVGLWNAVASASVREILAAG